MYSLNVQPTAIDGLRVISFLVRYINFKLIYHSCNREQTLTICVISLKNANRSVDVSTDVSL